MLQSHEIHLEQLDLPTDPTSPSAHLTTQFRRSLSFQNTSSQPSFTRNNFSGRGRGGRNNRPICQLCNRLSHLTAKYYHRFDMSFNGQPNQSTTSQNGPNNSGSQGHQAFMSVSSNVTQDMTWYLDSSVSHHITAYPSNLQQKSKYKGSVYEEGDTSRNAQMIYINFQITNNFLFHHLLIVCLPVKIVFYSFLSLSRCLLKMFAV